MSRDLPNHPHIDHLKKQAKVLLRSLRETRADATLSDAQHALARQYGFASWPRLKAHVDSLPPAHDPDDSNAGGNSGNGASGGSPGGGDSPRPLFHRMTYATRQALFFSRYEATTLGRLGIAPEHVLLGVIRAAATVSRTLLDRAGVTIDEARAAVATVNPPKDEINEPVMVPFDSATKRLFHVAADDADALGHETIATMHLLVALMRESGTADSYLRERHVTPEAVRDALRSAAVDDLQ